VRPACFRGRVIARRGVSELTQGKTSLEVKYIHIYIYIYIYTQTASSSLEEAEAESSRWCSEQAAIPSAWEPSRAVRSCISDKYLIDICMCIYITYICQRVRARAREREREREIDRERVRERERGREREYERESMRESMSERV